MNMAEWKSIITEWLTEYNSLQEHEMKSFAAEHEHNIDVSTAIFTLFCEDESNLSDNRDGKLIANVQLLEDACVQLFSFYRSKEGELRKFTLQFVPSLIYTYLSAVTKGNIKDCRCIETLLIGIYNYEVVDETGKPKVVSFRLPSLAQASIYHEPLNLGAQFLTESALRRWEECDTKLVNWGPLPQVDVINTQNRLNVMTALLFVYNRHLSLLPKLALRYFCIASSSIVNQGFPIKKEGSTHNSNNFPRIPVSSKFLLELIQGSYFSMFNEFYTLAYETIKDVHRRGRYELFPDVMLVSSAVINSIQTNPSSLQDASVGLALSPATTTVAMSKSMITNASFRTKKLPDDIPIQAGQVVPTDSADMLTSITEEGETDSTPIQRGAGTRGSKAKLSAFPVLGKKKEGKDKVVEKRVTLKDVKTLRNSIGSGDMVDSISPVPQKKNVVEMVETNGSLKDERMSLTSDSLQNSVETSDSRSQVTTDSLERLSSSTAAMQVSSV